MLKHYTPSEWKDVIEYNLVFDDGRGNGLCFACDKAGNLLPFDDEAVNEARRRNRDTALLHPEKYVRFNKIVKETRRYSEPAHGLCDCGEEVYLYNQYMGACECPGCGKWYNLFGQELLPPDQWGEDY